MDTIDEIHRQRLALLIKEAGSQKKLADISGKAPAQISQWLNASPDSKTGRPRAMDRETAREFEKKCNKPNGWMDQPLGAPTEPVHMESSVFEALTSDELELLNNFRAMMDADQEALRKEISERAERIRAHMRKYSEHHGLPDLVAKEAAASKPKMAAMIALKVTDRLRQRSLLDDHPSAIDSGPDA